MCTFPFYFCILAFVEKNTMETEPPEIWETDEEKGFSIGHLKFRYLQIAGQ